VTRTKGAGPDEIAGALDEFNEALARHLDDLAAQGKADLAEAARPSERSPLAWHLFQDDVIESLGPISAQGDPVESLVDRLAEITPYTRDQISDNVRAWVGKKLLEYDRTDGLLVWRWS
jgi:hypothetical protein